MILSKIDNLLIGDITYQKGDDVPNDVIAKLSPDDQHSIFDIMPQLIDDKKDNGKLPKQ